MDELFLNKKEVVKKFFFDYGKLIVVLILFVIFLSCVVIIFSANSEKELRVVFFDVGQGDAIFVETPSGKQMLIDGGANNKILQKIDKEMSSFDKDIDVMIATHADADHVTGLIPVLEKYKVSHIIESPVAGHTNIFDDLEKHIQNEVSDGAKLHIAKFGDVIDFSDGVKMFILYPKENYFDDGKTNEASVSVLITYLDKTFLLTGDLPSTRESKLIEGGLLSLRPRRESADSNITVYKVGHHGSKTSSSQQLLSYIKPYYSVISAGKDNRYGHPNEETIERLKKYSKVILSTIDLGDVEFGVSGKSFEVK